MSKANLFNLFKTDTNLEESGIWYEISEGTKFLIRRLGGNNTRLKAAYAKYYKSKARLIESGQLPDEEAKTLMYKVFIDTCLADWEGVTDEDGNDLECTPENALDLFKKLPELYNALNEEANKVGNYRADLGNS